MDMNWTESCKKLPYAETFHENYDFFKGMFFASTFLYLIYAILAILGNGLVIVAILRSQNLQTPSYLLITSLAFTDFVVGLICYPFFSLINVFIMNKNMKAFCKSNVVMMVVYYFIILLMIVSLVMNTFISIDRYLALSLRHRYRIHVTKERVRFTILAGWLGPLSSSFCDQHSEVCNARNGAVSPRISNGVCYLLLLRKILQNASSLHITSRCSATQLLA